MKRTRIMQRYINQHFFPLCLCGTRWYKYYKIDKYERGIKAKNRIWQGQHEPFSIIVTMYMASAAILNVGTMQSIQCLKFRRISLSYRRNDVNFVFVQSCSRVFGSWSKATELWANISDRREALTVKRHNYRPTSVTDVRYWRWSGTTIGQHQWQTWGTDAEARLNIRKFANN